MQIKMNQNDATDLKTIIEKTYIKMHNTITYCI